MEENKNNDIPAGSGGSSSSNEKRAASQDDQQSRQQSGGRPGKKYYYNRYRNRRPSSSSGAQGSGESVPSRRPSFRKVSVVVPLLNEEESLKPLFLELKKVLKSLPSDYEIIFVDDGSTDKSLQIIRELVKIDNKIKYLSFRKNYGKSAALQVGFKEVTGDVVITMDADLQDDPAEIPNLLAKLNEGYDLVSGWKKVRYDPFIKRQSSKFFNFVTGLMSGIKIHDFNCGLKAYRSDVISNIRVYGELHRYMPVLADWQGFRITEIPVKHHPRRYGKTKFGVSRFFKGFIDLVTVIFTTRYVKRPMHLFGFLGALAFLIGFVVNGYLTYEWLIEKTYISNRPLLFLGILLIIVGVQFFSVGLLGEIMVHNFSSDTEYCIKDKK